MKHLLWALVAITICSGCAHKKSVVGDNKISLPGVMSVWSAWVKDKGSKFDTELNFTNESKQHVMFLSSDAHCYRGEVEGRIKNIGDRTVDLAPGATKMYHTHCDLAGNGGKGNFKIVIKEVYANPSADGLTKGKLLGKNVELVIPETNLK